MESGQGQRDRAQGTQEQTITERENQSESAGKREGVREPMRTRAVMDDRKKDSMKERERERERVNGRARET